MLGARPGRDRGRRRSSTRRTRRRPAARTLVRCRLELADDGWHATPDRGRRARTCSPRCSAPTRSRSCPAERGRRRGRRAGRDRAAAVAGDRLRWARWRSRFACSRSSASAPGATRLALELPERATVADALAAAGARARARRDARRAMPVRVARQPRVRRRRTPRSRAGDELALIPPVSGGATGAGRGPGHRRAALGRAASASSVGRPGAGRDRRLLRRRPARSSGSSTRPTREMAEERIASILAECVARARARGRRRRAPDRHRCRSASRASSSPSRPPTAARRSPARARRSTGSRPRRRSGSGRSRAGEGRWVEGTTPPADAGSTRLTHLDDERQRPDGRRRRQARDRAPRARRGAAADVARDRGGGRARRRARRATCSAPRGSPGSGRRSGPAS